MGDSRDKKFNKLMQDAQRFVDEATDIVSDEVTLNRKATLTLRHAKEVVSLLAPLKDESSIRQYTKLNALYEAAKSLQQLHGQCGDTEDVNVQRISSSRNAAINLLRDELRAVVTERLSGDSVKPPRIGR